MSLGDIQEIPARRLVLLIGTPGAGKSTFCHQLVLNSVAMNRPVIFVTTEKSPSEIVEFLKGLGMGEIPTGALNFVDAFKETVGLIISERPDTAFANCMDLTSLSIAITKLQERIGLEGVLLVFDSLTSPYIFSGTEVIKFIKLFLSKFAAEGNSVLACIDEGCGKEEDLVAMMSISDGIIRMAVKEGFRIINILKHPTVKPTEIKQPLAEKSTLPFQVLDTFWESHTKSFFGLGFFHVIEDFWKSRVKTSFGLEVKPTVRTEMGGYVNQFWLSFASWGGMMWDPKRFPIMHYTLLKETTFQGTKLILDKVPWHSKLLAKIFFPKSLSNVRTVKMTFSNVIKKSHEFDRTNLMEYIDKISQKDEHYLRGYEGAFCWGLEDIGGPLCFSEAAYLAGFFKASEKEERDWNVVETACVGEGSHYCEFKAVPSELNELGDRLTALDTSMIQKIEDRLLEQVTEFIIHGKPLRERPKLGSGVDTHVFAASLTLPALASERYRMAIRMAGAMAGKMLGEHLMNAGLEENEIIRRVIDFMEYCEVGKITLGETIRMKENCEAFGLETGKPSCFFTTGFLNGLFSSVKNLHVREVRCIAAGDPFCEWEII